MEAELPMQGAGAPHLWTTLAFDNSTERERQADR